MCDEAKSQLQIHGSFGIDSGSVLIEDTTLDIASWSNSLIICNLPDRGKGAGGSVMVENTIGKSNVHFLSIVSLTIDDLLFHHESDPVWQLTSSWSWRCNWRADLLQDNKNEHTIFPFELSKRSSGIAVNLIYDYSPTWTDSTLLKDSCISVSGTIDVNKQEFSLTKIFMGKSAHTLAIIIPSKLINFDTFGFVGSNTDTLPKEDSHGAEKYIITYYNGSISFPPKFKNTINKEINNPIEIFVKDNLLIVNSKTSLGPTTASLYTIDGRLLKRTKIDISAPGIYTLDVSDLHSHFTILVLQTEKGIITKKILF